MNMRHLPGLLVVLFGVARPAAAQRCVVAEVEVPAMHVGAGAREQLLVIFRDRNGLPCELDPPFTVTSSNPNVVRVARGSNGIWELVAVSVGAAAVTVRTGTGSNARTGIGTVVVTAASRPKELVQPMPAPVTTRPAGTFNVTLMYQRPGTAPAVGIIAQPERMQMLPGEARVLSYRTAAVDGGSAEPLALAFGIEPSHAVRFVQVDSIGIVTATDTGRATIRISAVGRPNVRPALVPVEVRADSVVFTRRTIELIADAYDTVPLRVPSQGRLIALGQIFRFMSSDTAVAAVHLFQPVIQARAPGTAVITATNPRFAPVQLVVRVARPTTDTTPAAPLPGARGDTLDAQGSLRLGTIVVTVRGSVPAENQISIVPVGESAVIEARALSGNGTLVPGVPFFVRLVDPESAFRFDSTTGALRAVRAGAATVIVFSPLLPDSIVARSVATSPDRVRARP